MPESSNTWYDILQAINVIRHQIKNTAMVI